MAIHNLLVVVGSDVRFCIDVVVDSIDLIITVFFFCRCVHCQDRSGRSTPPYRHMH